MGVSDQIKTAFQDIIAPELHALRGDIRLLDQKIAGVDQKIDGVDQKLSQSTAWIVSCGRRSTSASASPPSKPAAPPDLSTAGSDQPRPTKGILVAMTVMNWTFASSGRPAM